MVKQRVNQLVYGFIKHFIQQQGIPPTVAEIAAGCHIEVTRVERSLGRLEQAGRLIRQPGKARGLRLPELEIEWERDERVRQVVQAYRRVSGRWPSARRIATGCGLSVEEVVERLYRMQSERPMPTRQGRGTETDSSARPSARAA